MQLKEMLPEGLKHHLRNIRQKIKKVIYRPKSLDELHDYWKNPGDDENNPEIYLSQDARKRSQYLVDLVGQYVDKKDQVFELGCNVGRNLNFLYTAGFTNLEAIEISRPAIELMEKTFPEMYNSITIYNNPAEEVIKNIASDSYKLVFTMAVLEHIHTDSEWLFSELVRISNGYLLTFEDEVDVSWRHFPRNYRKIFEPLGMEQIYEEECDVVRHGLGAGFYIRIFRKPA